MDDGVFAVEIKAKGLDGERFEEGVGEASEFDSAGSGSGGRFDSGLEKFRRFPFDLRDANRDDGGVVAGAEFAGDAFDGFGVENGVTGKVDNGREFALHGIDGKLHDRHGGNGADVMRIKNAEKGLSDFRKIVVDFEMDAGGEKGESLNEALDVRVFTDVRAEDEARGDLWIFFGKLSAHLAQEREFAFVII
jgi:hypothetical protein